MEQTALLEAGASGQGRVGLSVTIARPKLGERARNRLRRIADGAKIRGGLTVREGGRSEAQDVSPGGKFRGVRQDRAFPTSYERPVPAETSGRELGGRGSGSQLSANAVAGAIAGTLVSIVLHPVDTIKVTIQADRKVREPIAKVVSRIIRRRGVFGLYSGLSTSLASSAPISAIYTASYELVKERLMPGLPEEKRWIAHCIAGGCASVATSFVYTPSECIKQRCQVTGATGAFAAARSLVRADGVLGLYKGWSAVLCRNIPQSAIKFFVFEQLMRAAGGALSSSGESPGTLPTLAIGGVAGSTAAMFTTPFDTIKTRLQTAGVVNQGGSAVRGLIPTMRDIVVNEGVGGLYRGVIPRLFIYVTQSAVFFATYEVARNTLLDAAEKRREEDAKAAK
tara:strand:+ start:2187 stop:3374 length:1188 start_codon:yes stop_codon:yes gene_type:complete